MIIDSSLTPAALATAALRTLSLAGDKALRLDHAWNPANGTPVFTVNGTYTTRGWTEWTQGFQFGLPLLAFDATNSPDLLALGRARTTALMAPHISHTGVHDHGFNNLSTYGTLRRLMRESRIPHNPAELAFYELALKLSASVQASRWSNTADHKGYIYSFNGPHSLFIDTLRTLRILAVAHQLGHAFMGENDARISLLQRLTHHALTTAQFNIFYGTSRDHYDTRPGRTAHEAIFNTNDGRFRCPNSQQGYSPFSTWTRGLAWAVLGFAEQLEFLAALPDSDLAPIGFPDRTTLLAPLERAATATADFYIHHATAADGIPYWDTGAPNLHLLKDWQSKPANPFNDHEPVDSSAAAIAAQGLLRLGKHLNISTYTHAALTTARTLFSPQYLAESPAHQGLLLHSIYHRPNGWDHIPPSQNIPSGESSMWGDYHLAELALTLHRLANPTLPYYKFFD